MVDKVTIQKIFAFVVRKIFDFLTVFFRKEIMESLARNHEVEVRFSNSVLPQKIEGFEDFSFLFWCSPLNRGLIRMDFDEAAYLFKLLNTLKDPLCVEIGRYKGGATFLIASGLKGGKVISIDLHTKMRLKEMGKIYDAELCKVLSKFGLKEKVELVIADSKEFDNRGLAVDLLFIDGDHSYEGVKADFTHWIDVVKKGGHILFHDGSTARRYTTVHPGIKKFIKEIEHIDWLEKVKEVGSLVHVIKTE
jgi:predicted O-methyltransferase YrrM